MHILLSVCLMINLYVFQAVLLLIMFMLACR